MAEVTRQPVFGDLNELTLRHFQKAVIDAVIVHADNERRINQVAPVHPDKTGQLPLVFHQGEGHQYPLVVIKVNDGIVAVRLNPDNAGSINWLSVQIYRHSGISVLERIEMYSVHNNSRPYVPDAVFPACGKGSTAFQLPSVQTVVGMQLPADPGSAGVTTGLFMPAGTG